MGANDDHIAKTRTSCRWWSDEHREARQRENRPFAATGIHSMLGHTSCCQQDIGCEFFLRKVSADVLYGQMSNGRTRKGVVTSRVRHSLSRIFLQLLPHGSRVWAYLTNLKGWWASRPSRGDSSSRRLALGDGFPAVDQAMRCRPAVGLFRREFSSH